MHKYKVLFKPSADRALQKLPHDVQRRIVGEVAMLAQILDRRGWSSWPAMIISGIRIGNYRVVYEIHDDRLVVLVLRVAHRKDVYRP